MEVEARLRAFAAFARQRSFSAAAQELCISQPAVSKHIADLERALGPKLVERGRRGGALTSAGQFLANYVLRAESLLAQAVLGAAEFRAPRSGSLTLVASGTIGTYLLPEIIAAFQQANPGVRVSLELRTSMKAVEWLRSHRAELGFVGGSIGAPEIEAQRLLDDELVLVGTRQLAARRLSREQLEALTWISREEGSATRTASDAALANLGIVPQRRLELPSWEAIKLAVKRGYGIAACSRFAVDEELRVRSLAVVPVRGWNVRKTMSVIRVRDAALTPSAEQFLLFLRGYLRQMICQRRSKKRLRTTPA
jgi:LysR family transcriptional regulator, transcriptional activator of the cysJI operon